ncbi:MAG: DNA-3-methyladenine glycosylase family protein [Gammaproteobacteria bacterium]
MEHIKAFEALQKKSKKLGFQVLAEHIKNVGPLKIKTSKMDFVAHLVKIIVGQQLSVQSAAAIWKRTELILKKNEYKNANKNLDKKFKGAGLSRQKIEYINGIIFNKNLLELSKKSLKKLSPEEYYELLISIKGIGPWSIEMSRIFYIGDPDIFSILDLGLKNAHLRLFDLKTYNESFYENFSPFRSYMCLFLWRVLEDENVTI